MGSIRESSSRGAADSYPCPSNRSSKGAFRCNGRSFLVIVVKGASQQRRAGSPICCRTGNRDVAGGICIWRAPLAGLIAPALI